MKINFSFEVDVTKKQFEDAIALAFGYQDEIEEEERLGVIKRKKNPTTKTVFMESKMIQLFMPMLIEATVAKLGNNLNLGNTKHIKNQITVD